MTDLYYTTSGWFTHFVPNTKDGETVWRELNELGFQKILTIHLKPVLMQIKAAGYTVRKAPKCKLNDDELLAELFA